MKYKTSVLTKIYKRIVGAMSGLSEITINLEDDVTPHFNPSNMSITTFPIVPFARNDDEDFEVGRGIMLHETSHVLFAPDISGVIEDLRDDFDELYVAEFMHWLNIFLDANNEWKVVQLYPHLEQAIRNKTNVIFEVRPEQLESNNPFMQTCMRTNKICDIKPVYPADFEYSDFVDQVVGMFELEQIIEANGETVICFAKRIQMIWDKLKDKKIRENKANQKKISEFMKEMGEAIANGLDEKVEKLDKKIKDLKGKGEGKSTMPVEKNILNVKIPKTRNNTGGIITNPVNYSGYTLDELKKMLEEKAEKIKNEKAGGAWGKSQVDVNNKVQSIQPNELFKIENKSEDADFKTAMINGKKINAALRKKIKLQEDFETKHRNGILDFDQVRQQISKSGMITKPNVFQRKENAFSRGGEYAVDVLVDLSGSMQGDKMVEAKKALATLAFALNKLPNINFALHGFTYEWDGEEKVYDVEIKKYSETFKQEKLQEIQSFKGNADGINIRAAIKRMMPYSHMKRIIIVISDGQPAYTNGIEDTKAVVKEAQRRGINVIGIGIEGATEVSLKKIYPNNYLFEETDKLHEDITNLILSSLNQKHKRKLVKCAWDD